MRRTMKRGGVVTVAAAGDYGKRRPAVIIQTDALPAERASVVAWPLPSPGRVTAYLELLTITMREDAPSARHLWGNRVAAPSLRPVAPCRTHDPPSFRPVA